MHCFFEIPAASTWMGCTTRLDSIKARQVKLAGLDCFVHVHRDLRAVGVVGGYVIAGLTPCPIRPEKSRTGPRFSKSRDTPQVSPAMEVLGKQRFAITVFFPVSRRLPVAAGILKHVHPRKATHVAGSIAPIPPKYDVL